MRNWLFRGVAPLLVLSAVFSGAALGADVKLRYTASGYVDKETHGLRGPEGIACTDDGKIVVSDTGNGRLARFTIEGDQLKPGAEIKLPEGVYPTRLQIGSKGQLFGLDAKARRVFSIEADGAPVIYLETSGVPDSSTLLVRSFRVDREDNVYLLDSLRGRVVVVDPKGQYLRSAALPLQAGSLDDLALDGRGTLYVLDGVKGALYSAPKGAETFTLLTGKLGDVLNFSGDLAIDSAGGIYLADQSGGGLVLLTPDGTFRSRYSSVGWKEGLLQHPTQLCVNEKRILVADRDNSRIQLFSIEQ